MLAESYANTHRYTLSGVASFRALSDNKWVLGRHV